MAAHNEHHYIPKFLLKAWHSGEDEKLSQMRWSRGQITEKRYKAKSVAKERHLYSMKRLSDQPNQEIEPKFMSRHIDDPAALVHKAILANGLHDMSEDQKMTWTLFLVSLVYRGPGAIEHVRESGIDALYSQFTDEVEGAAGPTESSKRLFDLYRQRDPSLQDFGTYALPELIQTSSYNKLFFEADWGIRRIVKTKEMLLVGDRPLTLFGPETRLDLIYLPLAPDVAFFASNSTQMKQWVNSLGDSQFVKQMNRGMVEQASMYVWGSNFEHRRLLELRLHRTRAGRGIGIGPRPTL
ncbi:DUF4238 domain-containing protein [Cupriavidus sp. SW-Y-13]|uniref:DUF4238 domain-containing protein n=1 Tax=Cupriavidus sp. SW-Y-13 TaxID=2653854 RepID=UPI00136530BB|nr:DUF4238 domain-containing protein [Cupriavidus sp. SW-Y-13]MWL91224.1 DUF4238 domain-containing protein [Cupriavidus sp. SW-Y-13]